MERKNSFLKCDSNHATSEQYIPLSSGEISRHICQRSYIDCPEPTISQRKVTQTRQYESEYDKLNRLLQNSENLSRAKSQKCGHVYGSSVSHEDRYTRPRAHTTLFSLGEELYMGTEEIASAPRKPQVSRTKTAPVPSSTNFGHHQPAQVNPEDASQLDSAIYGVAQGRGLNLVMEFKELQASVGRYYRLLLDTSPTDPRIADLRILLKVGSNFPMTDILHSIHEKLAPPIGYSVCGVKSDVEYLIDFHKDSSSKCSLKEKVLNLFVKRGPPSVMYQKITSKLDSVIDLFCEEVIQMRLSRNETIASPFQAYCVIKSVTSAYEGEYLASALRRNELWIRWATDSGLPPLAHLYMLKHSPSYEMRKAVVLSLLADRKDKILSMLSDAASNESLIPPIYGRLDTKSDTWQVTQFNLQSGKMETSESKLPHWVEECPKLSAHLKSSNRTIFAYDDHIYSLYSVYLIAIKDISLSDASYGKEIKPPSSHQLYIGSSTTGVLFKFHGVDTSHAENIKKILEDSQTMSSFRGHQNYALVDACLALAWTRRQPRAVFVINSFHEKDMVRMSLDKKKPFNDKMLSLQKHYVYSKKLGPTNDMRYGMNELGEISYL